jgi:hypothetical protein
MLFLGAEAADVAVVLVNLDSRGRIRVPIGTIAIGEHQ